MKKFICLIFIISIAFGCSKSEEDENEIVSACFVVIDLTTELPVREARVSIGGYVAEGCEFFGDCKTRTWNGLTNQSGEVCINYDSDYRISSITATHPQYNTVRIETMGLMDQITEIYLEPLE